MELPDIPALARRLGGGEAARTRRLSGRPRRARRRGTARRWARNISSAPGSSARPTGPYFIDKLPNNWAHVGLIHLILPNAKIIDARRHPLDCCFSNFKQHYARGQGFSYALDDMGRYYADYVALMAHFDAVLPGRVHRRDPRAADRRSRGRDPRAARLSRPGLRAGLPRFHETERAVRTASSEQVRRPINRDGVGQWQPYEPWLGPLKAGAGPGARRYPDGTGQALHDRSQLAAIDATVRSFRQSQNHLTRGAKAAEFSRDMTPKGDVDMNRSTRAGRYRRCWPRPCSARTRRRLRRRTRPLRASDAAGAPAGAPTRRRRHHRHRAEALARISRTCRSASRRSAPQQLEELNVSNFHDYTRLLPSISFQTLQPGHDQRLYPRRRQRRRRQPFGLAALGRRLSRRAAGHDDRRHARRPYLRHRPHRGAARPAGHALRRLVRSRHDPHHHQQARHVRLLRRGRRRGQHRPPRRHRRHGRRLRQRAARADNAAIRVVGWYQHDAGYIDNVAGTRAFLPPAGRDRDQQRRPGREEFQRRRRGRRPRRARHRSRRQLDGDRQPARPGPAQRTARSATIRASATSRSSISSRTAITTASSRRR